MKRNVRSGEPLRWLWLVVIAAIVALLGGSSRADVIQITALRPLALILLIPVIYAIAWGHMRKAPYLLVVFAGLIIWMAIQLIPLPPSIFAQLEARSAFSSVDGLLLGNQDWQSISLVPSRGWNAFFSALVPFTALLLALVSGARSRLLLLLVASTGLLDALLGFLQILGGRSSPIYFYSITSRGASVGIFANENHSAVFSSIVLLILTWLFLTFERAKDPAWLRYLFAPAFVVVFLSAMVSGSRGGLALSLAATLVSIILVAMRNLDKRSATKDSKLLSWVVRRPAALAGIFSGLVFALLASFISLGRSRAFENILAQNAFEDLRWSLWPVLEEMMSNHWVVGTGFGSFEEVYHFYEPTDLLFPSYVNQAHNDWAQLVIEGGLPAVILLIALLGWIGSSLYKILRQENGVSSFLLWGSSFTILCAASLVDYPLRTPIFQVCAVWLLLAMHFERLESQSS